MEVVVSDHVGQFHGAILALPVMQVILIINVPAERPISVPCPLRRVARTGDAQRMWLSLMTPLDSLDDRLEGTFYQTFPVCGEAFCSTRAEILAEGEAEGIVPAIVQASA